MNRISAVIIAFNEEKRIRQMLESVRWCDEIVVVDSGSTDNTVEICKEYDNCRVFSQPFLGFGAQKKYAVGKAANDWVLSIDADEVVSAALRNEITALLSLPVIGADGFYVPITLIFMQRIFRFGSENKYLHLRLFNRKKGNFNEMQVHESVEVEGTVRKLSNELFHYSYLDIHHLISKYNEYSTYYMNQSLKRGKHPGKIRSLIRFKWEFLRQYFLRLNFMNGYPGFIWSVFSAFYVFTKYTKLYEANLKK